jgi:hypothetical protein
MLGQYVADQAVVWPGEQEYQLLPGQPTAFKLVMVDAGMATAADIHVFQTSWVAVDVVAVARDVVRGAVRTLPLAVAVAWQHIITLVAVVVALADTAIHYVTKLLQDM